MIKDMENKTNEYAMLSVVVTSSCGLEYVRGAEVTVSYNGPPGGCEKKTEHSYTDENGKTDTFFLYTRRARIGSRYVNLPKYAKCDVAINAEGYVPLKVREVPIFPGITVVRSFDLISQNKK